MSSSSTAPVASPTTCQHAPAPSATTRPGRWPAEAWRRTLTLHAGQPDSSIPKEFRLKVPPSSPSAFHFRDVTDASGTLRLALGRGAAWGDFDNDGYEDIIVGAERAPFCLFRNRGDGT